VMWSELHDLCEVILFWSEENWSELRWGTWGKSTMYINV